MNITDDEDSSDDSLDNGEGDNNIKEVVGDINYVGGIIISFDDISNVECISKDGKSVDGNKGDGNKGDGNKSDGKNCDYNIGGDCNSGDGNVYDDSNGGGNKDVGISKFDDITVEGNITNSVVDNVVGGSVGAGNIFGDINDGAGIVATVAD